MITTILIIIAVILSLSVISDIGLGNLILIIIGLGALLFFVAYLVAKKEEKVQALKDTDPEKYDQIMKARAEREANAKVREENNRIRREAEDRKKYNDYKYTCPMCKSHNVRNLTFDEKTMPGHAASRVGKNYICDDCDYIW